jgi:uncharacterized RDD family membrane protein YckC
VSAAPPGATPGLARRLASASYDFLLVAAVVLVATFPFLAILGDATHGWRRHVLQGWIVLVSCAYFVGFWTHGGRTLAMKTWRIRLVAEDGRPVGTVRAVHRFSVALLGLCAAGAGFAWALVDRERQFLHDRLSGTRLVADEARGEPRG